jgi:hypothetical protein
MIKDYVIEVEESTALEAVLAVVDGRHGQMIEDTQSGEFFYPSDWIVKSETGAQLVFDRTELQDFN